MPRKQQRKVLGFQGLGKGVFTAIFGELNAPTRTRRVTLKSGFTVQETYKDTRKRRYEKNPQAFQSLRIRRK